MAINDNFLRELQERTDIEQLVGSYVDLKRRGKTFVGLCPFHNEKTPSFTVYPDSNSFYCFGCGTHGDVIDLTAAIFGLPAFDAARKLAWDFHVPLDKPVDPLPQNEMSPHKGCG